MPIHSFGRKIYIKGVPEGMNGFNVPDLIKPKFSISGRYSQHCAE
jgi:hypothetical protein